MEGFRTIVSAGLCLLLLGCSHGPPPEYPVWLARRLPSPPSPGSANGFDSYATAAIDVENGAGKYLDRVFFTPKQREIVAALAAKGLALVEQGVHKRCDFQFEPAGPFEAPPYLRGWRLLGNALVWRIRDAVAVADYSKAIKTAITATKFGFDICGGGAAQLSLGLSIADGARKAISPAIGRMQTMQLAALAEGLENALHGKPPLAAAIRNEGLNMMAAVQYIQDAYRIGDYAELEKNLGFDTHSEIDYLKELPRDGAERVAYFRGFAADADDEVAWLTSQAACCAADRKPAKTKTPEKRPWWRFAHHFFFTMRPLITCDDMTVDRTSLLIIEATIQRIVRSGRPAPPSLGEFPTWLTTDRFSGKAFIYRSDGQDFDVYSVGQDLRDDDGETDESFTTPDLRSESGLH
jgi:hypothetical protein